MAVRGGLYILAGELEEMVQAMRFGFPSRSGNVPVGWDPAGPISPLLSKFFELKETLSNTTDLCEIEPSEFLQPFLDVIRSPETTGPTTGAALFSVNKFISCNLIDSSSTDVSAAVASIADAVTHARFVGTDPSRDEVVLMQILQVLRTLMLSPCGSYLTNESVCEMLQSCFRICFEVRLSELLRTTSEQTLTDMIKLLFSRLPSFKEDTKTNITLKKLKSGRMSSHKPKTNKKKQQEAESLAKTKKKEFSSAEDISSKKTNNTSSEQASETSSLNGNVEATASLAESPELKKASSDPTVAEEDAKSDVASPSLEIEEPEEFAMVDITEDESCDQSDSAHEDYVNPKGVRFTHEVHHMYDESTSTVFIPHGLPCVREVFRFLISLINPYDEHNYEYMIKISLSLLTVAMEVASDSIANFSSILQLARDELCKHLFSLLNCQRFHLVLPSLRLAFLVFESIRSHLKLQMECYLIRIMDIMKSDSISPDIKEKAIDFLVKMFKVPGLAAEVYINYDCDIYCSNLFEDMTKLLSKNAFPVAGLQNCHVLSLDALLALIDTVSAHCQSHNDRRSEASTQKKLDIAKIKERKKFLESATDQFNQKPKKGIENLQEHGFLPTPTNYESIAKHLRENWRLDKKMIGEYISDKKTPQILSSYLSTFSFSKVRVDEALRMFLESFRLPGEAPIISYILEEFSKQWHDSNNRPFVNDDAVYVLAYAVVLLNTDQHNPQAKRQNIPMTLSDFKNNVRGINGGKDFDHAMLEEIYHGIKSKEIVIPTEQSGPLKENYIWKELSVRSTTAAAASATSPYLQSQDGAYNYDIFALVWGSTVAALSFVFDKSMEEKVILRSIKGFRKCAQIAAFYGSGDVFDNLVISLCKFTTLVNISDDGPELVPYYFGFNAKAQLAAKTMFQLAHDQGDTLREGWKNIVDCLQNLFKCKLLPKSMIEVEDFVEASGKISLIKEDSRNVIRNDSSGLLSSFYSYFAGSDSPANKGTSQEDQEALKHAKVCILECKPDYLISESKFLQEASLLELVKALRFASQGPEARLGEGVFEQDLAVFNLELLIQITIQNRDRISLIWPQINQHLCDLISEARSCTFLVQRAVVGLIRLCMRLLRNENIASELIQSLRVLLFIEHKVMKLASRQVSFGMYELIKTNAANIHSSDDWIVILALLEVSGTGTRFVRCGSPSKNETVSKPQTAGSKMREIVDYPCLGEFVLKDKEKFGIFDLRAFIKSWQSVALIVQDTAHVTPYNLEPCVHIIKSFAEASVAKRPRKLRPDSPRQQKRTLSKAKPSGSASNPASEDEDEIGNSQIELIIQLLNRVEELHGKAPKMLKSWAEEDTTGNGNTAKNFPLWKKCWLPILQSIGFLCADPRRDIRMDALGRLQRCLLTNDMLLDLAPNEWEECFILVFIPILYEILEDLNPNDPSGVEETRMRAANTLSKVFLQRLNTLMKSTNFLDIWVDVLNCMKRYMTADKSELLAEAIPESLKNILLVMQTARLFEYQSQFSIVTWKTIDEFLPNLKEEVLSASPTATPNREFSSPVNYQYSTQVPLSVHPNASTGELSSPHEPKSDEPGPVNGTGASAAASQRQPISVILQPPLPEAPSGCDSASTLTQLPSTTPLNIAQQTGYTPSSDPGSGSGYSTSGATSILPQPQALTAE